MDARVLVEMYVCGQCGAPLALVDGNAVCTADPEHAGYIRTTTAAIRELVAAFDAGEAAANVGLKPEPHWIRNQEEDRGARRYISAYLCAECGAGLQRGFVDGVQAVVCTADPEHSGYVWAQRALAEERLAGLGERERRNLMFRFFPDLAAEEYPGHEPMDPGESLALLEELCQ